jgi:hypothetical protein
LWTLPPNKGHNSPKILNNELLPHPFGPVIIKFIPGTILKFIALINVSPLGDKIGTFSKTISSLYIISPRFFKELSINYVY